MVGDTDGVARAEDAVATGVARVGGISYLHIPAEDVRAAARFYRDVLDWTVHNADSDRPGFEDGTGHVGGAWVRDQVPSREPGLLPYVYVADVDATIARVVEYGGSVVRAPYPEGALRIATFRDPAGNVMGIWQGATG